MKKIASIMAGLMLILGLSFVLTACGDTNSNKIRLVEVTHSIFYAPLYVALNNGYFEDEGLEVELTNAGGSDKGMTALVSGSADIALVGPETVVYVVEGQASDHPVVFGQLTKRDGSFIVAKTDTNNFQWSDLVGKTIIGGRKGGMPAMTLQYVIEKVAGLTIGTEANQVNLRTDVAFDLTASVFESTDAEYCTLFEPTASDMETREKGYVVASVGLESGEVPYTAFTATKSYLENNRENAKKFLKAVMRGLEFLKSATVEEIAAALKPSFDTFSDADIVTAINSYIASDAWNATPVMSESAYNRMLDIMENAGELDNRESVPFTTVVDNSIANELMAELVA